MIAADIMTREVITVNPDMEIHKLAKLFIEKDISGAPVVDESGKFLGIVLEEGLIVHDKKIHLPTFFFMLSGFLTFGEKKFENEFKKIASSTVSGIMEESVMTINPEMPVEDIATIMIEKNIHYFPVMDNGKLAGVVTKKDIVKAMAKGEI